MEKFTVESIENEDYLVFSAFDDDGTMIEPDLCKRLFSLSGNIEKDNALLLTDDIIAAFDSNILAQKTSWVEARNARDMQLFTNEMEKLDRWADDQRLPLHTELRELEQEIRLRRNLARQMSSLAERIKEQRAVTDLEKN